MGLRIENFLKLTLIALLMAWLCGCASPSATITKGQQASGKIEARLDSAHDSAVKVQKLVSGNLAGYVDDIIDDIVAAKNEMPGIRTALATGAQAVSDLQEERTWWISYRVHRDFKWTIAGVAVLLIVMLALFVLSNLTGPVGMVAAGVFHTLTGGLVLIGRSISNAVKKNPVTITVTGPGTPKAPLATGA